MIKLNEETRCKIVKYIQNEYNQRAIFGEKKYGKTLSENDSDILTRLQHLKEELMDATLYVYWCMLKIKEQEAIYQEFELIDIESELACGNCERLIDLHKGKVNFCPNCGCKIKYKEPL